MKILVSIKRVIDPEVPIRVRADESGIDITNGKMIMNLFDEVAVEEAIRLKEQGLAQEVIVMSIGVAQCQDILRRALGMGADRALLVETSLEIQPLGMAEGIAAIVRQEHPSLVLVGRQATDDDATESGQMLAGLLDWSQGISVAKLTIDHDHAIVTCETDAGHETLRLRLPAVITTSLHLNQPRYVSLPNTMRAKRKPITTMTPQTLDIDLRPRLTTLKVSEAPRRPSGIMVSSVAELIDKLRNAAQVI